MKEYSVVGVDTSKRVFELCGVDRRGKVLLRKRLYRDELVEYFAKLGKTKVAMEACGGTHYWAREFRALGHEVKLIAPQFVKPYVKSNKNDRADAEAIAEAASRPGMRFVAVKEVAQQELQHLHRVRSRKCQERTAANNELRGILSEYGIVLSQGTKALKLVPELVHHTDKMSQLGKNLTMEVYQDVLRLNGEIKALDARLEKLCLNHPVSKRLTTIPGVGTIIATAIVAAVGDPNAYKNGRSFSASLGLVPKHTGTAGKNRNQGISKRGDTYIRMQLIHGARSILYRAHTKTDHLSRWAAKLRESRGWNRACVALANKNARIIWALLKYGTHYTPRAA